MQKNIWKKAIQLKKPISGRHLKYGVGYFVKEAVSGWRIVYKEEPERRIIRSILSHDEYEKWLKSSEFFRAFFLFVR